MGKLSYVNVSVKDLNSLLDTLIVKCNLSNVRQRKIEGEKLCQVVVKDILKRLPGGSGHKAALRDPNLEFDVARKSLDDKAFHEITRAILKAYSSNALNATIIKLEEISIGGNHLTVKSMEDIAGVIWMAYRDIRDLDLSHNDMTIASNEDARAWEILLCALGSCPLLRRVDFSGNNLGPKGFEVLAKVYLQDNPDSCPFTPAVSIATSPSLSPKKLERYMKSLSVDSGQLAPSSSTGLRKQEVDARRSFDLSVPDSENLKGPKPLSHEGRTELVKLESSMQIEEVSSVGIRHIPYLVFDKTAMTATCALHLSYIISGHDLPSMLLQQVPAPKAGQQAQQLEAYDQDARCRGIMYRDNGSIGGPGVEVLQFAERARMKGGEWEFETEPEREIAESIHVQGSSLRHTPDKTSSLATPSVRIRGASIMGSPVDSPGLKGKNLDTARSRIQGTTIQNAGVHSNELWSKAMKVFVVGRAVLLLPKSPTPTPIDTNGGSGTLTEEEDEYHPPKTPTMEDQLNPPSWGMMMQRVKPPVTPLAQASTNAPVLRLHNSKLIPEYPFGHGVKTMDDCHEDVKTQLDTMPHMPVRVAAGKESSIKARPVLLRPEKAYRSKLRFGLSEQIWATILGMSTGVEDCLSRRQLQNVVRRASDRGSLQKELECLGKPDSVQIWNVLSALDCLVYEPLDRI